LHSFFAITHFFLLTIPLLSPLFYLREFVDAHGGIGITLECGQHQDPRSIQVAKEASLAFLEALELIPKQGVEERSIPKHYHLYETLYPQAEDFRFINAPSNFSPLRAGEVFAQDSTQEYSTNQDAFLLMPSPFQSLDVEVGYLASLYI